MAEETKVIRIVVDSSKAVDGSRAATRALEQIEKQTGSMAQAMDKMGSALAHAGDLLKGFVVLALTDRLVGMAKASIDAAAGLDELATQMGITAAGLQALQYSAVQNGTKLEQLETGISKFSQKMGEAAGGSKEMLTALNNLGVKILDTQGNLRPTEVLLQNVAAKIMAIDDPARRSAASVDFFGKAGAKMLPMLADMAQGLDAMKGAAQRAGAMISDEAIAKLDALSDASERGQLKLRALFAENAAGPLTTAIDTINDAISNMSRLLKTATQDWKSLLLTLPLAVMSPGTIGASIFGKTPIGAEQSKLAAAEKQIAVLTEERSRFTDPTVTAEYDKKIKEQQDARYFARVALERLNAPKFGDSDTLPTITVTGDRNPPPNASGGGESPEEKYAKLIQQLTIAAAAQDKMTASARAGDQAFADQQATLEAQNKTFDIFKAQLSDADPRLAKVRDLLRDIAQGKAAQAFTVATTELEKQNTLLEAQIALMNEAPEVQAREIAIIKSKQEAQKAGNALTAEDIENRRKAIEQNETLKLQAEQMKAANELWTAPFKRALENIQTAGADAWETILETGKISFESLGDVFIKTLRRMAAEFLALATIRPVMSLFVDVIGPGGAGLIGGNTAAQLGFPSGAGGSSTGGGIGSIFGGSGLGSIFGGGGTSGGGGWLSRQISGVSSFLQQPIYGGMGSAGLSGSPYYGPPSPSAGLFSGSGPSWGQGIGAGISIASGAYGLLKGGQSTAGTIGSVGQMVGGVVTMLPIPGAQIVGPAISILSSIIPGLFGSSEPPIPPQPKLQYSMGNFWSAGGGGYQYGGDGGGRSIGTSVMAAFRSAGLTVVPGNLYGGELAGGTDHVLNGRQWQDRPYTQTALTLPGGGIERLTYNDSSMNADQAGQYLLAQVFKANVMRGGVSGAGPGLMAGLDKINPTTSEDLDRVVSLGTAYDRLGKSINPAKDALDKISASFDDLKDFATQAGLSLDPINAELKKQSKRSAQDFIDAMLDPLAVQMRALEDERQQAVTSAEYIRDNVKDVYVDMDRIATYYTNKEAALRDQFYQGGVSNLQALIDRLTYGDLANASPTLQLSGTRTAYEAALQQARAGDSTAITNLAGYAESYLGTARQNFASSPEYQALVDQIREAAQEITISLTGGTATTPSGAIAQQTATGQQIAQLTAMVQDLAAQREEERRENAELRDLLQRYVTGRTVG